MDDSDPGLQLVHLLRGITVELDLFGAAFARTNGLHPTDVRALIHLLDDARAGTAATPGRLAGQLGLDASTVTALVDRLERLGLVGRDRDPADRRRVLLRVEKRAVTLGWSFFGPLISGMVAATADFAADELATVRRFLLAMTDVVSAPRGQAPPRSAAAPPRRPGTPRAATPG